MQLVTAMTRHFTARARRSKPERLWLHYAIALTVIFGLLAAIGLTNREIAKSDAATAAAIRDSNAQIQYGREILTQAYRIAWSAQPDFKPFETAVDDFVAAGAAVATILAVPETAAMVDRYVVLAQDLQAAAPGARPGIVARMAETFDQAGLEAALVDIAAQIEAKTNARTTRLIQLQRSLVTVALCVMVIEALFIFLPAQLATQLVIDKLRRQTKSLQNSQLQLQQMNARLERLANHDRLTGLPNRGCLTAHLADAISHGRSAGLGVLFIGLDDFKAINDTAGHDYGDELLIAVADMLHSCIDDEDIVARIGGDEFVIVTSESAADVAKRVNTSFGEPFDIKGRKFPVNASIGLLEVLADHDDAVALIADAGIALQTAKNAGGHRTEKYSPDLRAETERLQRLQADLATAIDQGQIEPWFQPQIRLSDGILSGVEVLARWQHPELGLLTPDRFLPAAERAGLLIPLDHAIWQSAMTQAVAWQQTGLWYPRISLNAAPDTIADPYLVERILLQIQRSGLSAEQVIVEVLETTFIDGSDDMAAINIDSLDECGIAVELDDFGTGYASLSKLNQLPLSGIKLDRSLIAPLPAQGADSIVRAILAMAGELGLHVVAEGIEDDAQARHLNERGCLLGQGYGFARPMPPDAFRNWLRENSARCLSANDNVLPMPNRA